VGVALSHSPVLCFVSAAPAATIVFSATGGATGFSSCLGSAGVGWTGFGSGAGCGSRGAGGGPRDGAGTTFLGGTESGARVGGAWTPGAGLGISGRRTTSTGCGWVADWGRSAGNPSRSAPGKERGQK